MEKQQVFNQALLKLCILLYHLDGKITLSEQDYFDALSSKIDWQGDEELKEFIVKAIYEVRQVMDNQEQLEFVNSMRDALNIDPKRALAVAQGLCYIDGEIAEEESEVLDYLQYRVLAKQLTQAMYSNAEAID